MWLHFVIAIFCCVQLKEMRSGVFLLCVEERVWKECFRVNCRRHMLVKSSFSFKWRNLNLFPNQWIVLASPHSVVIRKSLPIPLSSLGFYFSQNWVVLKLLRNLYLSGCLIHRTKLCITNRTERKKAEKKWKSTKAKGRETILLNIFSYSVNII